MLEFARHARRLTGRNILIVSPLMVIPQTIDETRRFYPDMSIDVVAARDLRCWLDGENGIGITNYEAIKSDTTADNLGGMLLDESSMLKSHYGKWGTKLIDMGRGVPWKLALTGTPAPNDRIEYANHAVFMDSARPDVRATHFMIFMALINASRAAGAEIAPSLLDALGFGGLFLACGAVQAALATALVGGVTNSHRR